MTLFKRYFLPLVEERPFASLPDEEKNGGWSNKEGCKKVQHLHQHPHWHPLINSHTELDFSQRTTK
ncbi:hypothetical protein CHS0354_009626, partial [Potamilus streckersoni]